jgi:hypothetical protein
MSEFLSHTIQKIYGPFTDGNGIILIYQIITKDKAEPPNFFSVLYLAEKPIFLKARMEIIIRISQPQCDTQVPEIFSEMVHSKFKTREKGKMVEHEVKKTIFVDSSKNSLNSVYFPVEKEEKKVGEKKEEKKAGEKKEKKTVVKKPEFQIIRDNLFKSMGLQKETTVIL